MKADAGDQGKQTERERFVGDCHGVTVTDSVNEQFGVALDRIPIDLNAVVDVENPLNLLERILRGMVKSEIDDRFAVEQLGQIRVNRFLDRWHQHRWTETITSSKPSSLMRQSVSVR